MPYKDAQTRERYHRKYREDHREEHRAYARDPKHKARNAGYKQKMLAKDPRLSRKQSLRSKYGISLEEYDRMHASQEGVCAICLRPETVFSHGKIKPLSVDHNHSTRAVRGLLCVRCNSAVGYLQDDPLLAESLAVYLRRY